MLSIGPIVIGLILGLVIGSQINDVRTNQMTLLANQNQCYIYNDTLAA